MGSARVRWGFTLPLFSGSTETCRRFLSNLVRYSSYTYARQAHSRACPANASIPCDNYGLLFSLKAIPVFWHLPWEFAPGPAGEAKPSAAMRTPATRRSNAYTWRVRQCGHASPWVGAALPVPAPKVLAKQAPETKLAEPGEGAPRRDLPGA